MARWLTRERVDVMSGVPVVGAQYKGIARPARLLRPGHKDPARPVEGTDGAGPPLGR